MKRRCFACGSLVAVGPRGLAAHVRPRGESHVRSWEPCPGSPWPIVDARDAERNLTELLEDVAAWDADPW